jgi:hypothetical protein
VNDVDHDIDLFDGIAAAVWPDREWLAHGVLPDVSQVPRFRIRHESVGVIRRGYFVRLERNDFESGRRVLQDIRLSNAHRHH